MIITRTPFRISFFGGGTDYPAWYLKEGGAVLSTTIDKYCYISCRVFPPFFINKHRIVWSYIEAVSSISEILHPAVREGLNYLGFDNSVGMEITHSGDLPARAGMGSSSSFAVGLINCLTALRGNMIDKHELAGKAIEFEHDILNETVGSQDQVATTYGGFNVIHFMQTGEFRVEPVTVPKKRILELESRLLLFYTGTSRFATEVTKKIVANLSAKRQSLEKMRQYVDDAVSILNENTDLNEFGSLLHENWMLKRELSSSVSNETIDSIYDKAIENGALGGKLLGAGSTGFMLFYVPEDKQPDVIAALSSYLHVPFQFETEGSKVIYYSSSDTKYFAQNE